MDTFTPIAAHHEAGHALLAYYVGWSIKFAELRFIGSQFIDGRTVYDYGGPYTVTHDNLERTLFCLLGGPAAQTMFEKKFKIDLDEHISDGRKIDELFEGVALKRKEARIEHAIHEIFQFLRSPKTTAARESIANELISSHTISSQRFIEIVKQYKVERRLPHRSNSFLLSGWKSFWALFLKIGRALKLPAN